jgi:hypothetical protein
MSHTVLFPKRKALEIISERQRINMLEGATHLQHMSHSTTQHLAQYYVILSKSNGNCGLIILIVE